MPNRQKQIFGPLADQSIDIICTYAPRDGREVLVAYSGGKDSCVLLDLVKRSGVPFHAVYRLSPLDPKELRAFIRQQAAIEENRLTIALPEKSLIQIARERGMMPLRNRRWCCEVIKERRNADPLTLTGIRWDESNRRARRKMMEVCQRTHGFMLHPIINWRVEDVWTYIRVRGLPYCLLYDEGFRRLGCVLCPMTRDTERQIQRFPWAVNIWRAISRACFDAHRERGRKTFATEQAQWEWWLNRDAKAKINEDCPLFGEGDIE